MYKRERPSYNHISVLSSSKRRNIMASSSSTTMPKHNSDQQIIQGTIELDSHADTIVAGANCVILNYTGRECDVAPYSDAYDSIQNVPIVTAATAWQSKNTGQTYILVFHEALWMGSSMNNTLINPNQLRHFGISVQDNPVSRKPLYIMTEDNDFSMELRMKGTIAMANTFTPNTDELNDCPHIILSSPHQWDPQNVTFDNNSITFEDEMNSIRGISSIVTHMQDGNLHDLAIISQRIISSTSSLVATSDKTLNKSSLDIGTADLPYPNTFQSKGRHTDVTASDLSERWCISITQATATLKNTTQKFLRSAILPLARRYRADRMYHRKTLKGEWSTDTMDARCKSLDGNLYAQVFANKGYFAKVYPMDKKSKCGEALKTFCREFGVPESLTFDGSKEQTGKNTLFMKQIRSNNIKHHVIEPEFHQQNPAEGVIRELRKKWFRIMVRKRVPRKLWDYGYKWVSETMSMTHTSSGGMDGSVPITKVTGETTDISEYLDFGFYDQVWYRDNAGLGPTLPGRWLGVSETHGNLMCYWILNENAQIVSRSSVQRVTPLELQTTDHSQTFNAFELKIKTKLNEKNRTYDGHKPNPEDWADYFENDDDFNA